MATEAVLEQLRHASVEALRKFRVAVPCGPFLILKSPDHDFIYSNYAVPLERTLPGDLQRLAEAMRGLARTPRIEYFHELDPDLRGRFADEGWTEEMANPVMALEPAEFSPLAAPDVVPIDSLEACAEAERVGYASFEGMGEPPEPVGASTWKRVREGVWLAFNALSDGKVVSTGGLQGDGPIPELCGVATLPKFRGQGYAAQVCSALCTSHFARGGQAIWLSASPDGRRLYEKIGFRTVGTQVNVSA